MSRPFKCRRIASIPDVTYFKPAGIPLSSLEEIRLSLEEAEALRLKDLKGLEQAQGAKQMNISRPTFQRVLVSARKKIADALLNGKAVRIEGGNYEIAHRRFRCHSGHVWEAETPTGAHPTLCPTCSTPDIQTIMPTGFGYGDRGRNKYNTSRDGAS